MKTTQLRLMLNLMPLPDETGELISVDHALSRGREMLKWPRILIAMGMFIFLFPLALLFIALKDGLVFSTNVWLAFGVENIFYFSLWIFSALFIAEKAHHALDGWEI